MSRIEIPAGALVVLVGAAGSGKTTFAARHFRATEILSTDAFRAMVADDAADQEASRDAFELVHLAARRRLERGLLTVIDATSVTTRARADLLALGRSTGRPVVAIVLDLPATVCLARNAARPGRSVASSVVARQLAHVRQALDGRGLAGEGFAAVHRLAEPAAIEDASIIRLRGGYASTDAVTSTRSRRPIR